MIRVIIFVVAIIVAAIYNGITSANRSENGEINKAGSLSAFDIKVGDCLAEEASQESNVVSSVQVVPCAEEHTYEVYADGEIDSVTYPGEEQVALLADEMCIGKFSENIGVPYEKSVLAYTHYSPTEESWNQGNDRTVSCLAFHMDGKQLIGKTRGV